MCDSFITFINILGALGEIVWALSIVETWIFTSNETIPFYNRHKVLRNIQLGLAIFGVLYFFYKLFSYQFLR